MSRKERQRAYREANRERLLARRRELYHRDRFIITARKRLKYQTNDEFRERVKAAQRARTAARKAA